MADISESVRALADAIDASDHLEILKFQPPDGMVLRRTRDGKTYGASIYELQKEEQR